MARRATWNSSRAALYFCGIAPAPDALTEALGAAMGRGAGTAAAPLATPGIAAAPDAAVGAAGALAAGRSRTLPVVAFGRSLAL